MCRQWGPYIQRLLEIGEARGSRAEEPQWSGVELKSLGHVAGCGCLLLVVAGCGWLWLVVAGCSWLWLGLRSWSIELIGWV